MVAEVVSENDSLLIMPIRDVFSLTTREQYIGARPKIQSCGSWFEVVKTVIKEEIERKQQKTTSET